MNSRITIVAYKPKPCKENELKTLALDHYQRLKAENLVTDRLPVLMQSKDRIIIEIFEWKSPEAIQQTHTNKAVGQMWQEFNHVCEYVPIGQVAESSSLFADYSSVI